MLERAPPLSAPLCAPSQCPLSVLLHALLSPPVDKCTREGGCNRNWLVTTTIRSFTGVRVLQKQCRVARKTTHAPTRRSTDNSLRTAIGFNCVASCI